MVKKLENTIMRLRNWSIVQKKKKKPSRNRRKNEEFGKKYSKKHNCFLASNQLDLWQAMPLLSTIVYVSMGIIVTYNFDYDAIKDVRCDLLSTFTSRLVTCSLYDVFKGIIIPQFVHDEIYSI